MRRFDSPNSRMQNGRCLSKWAIAPRAARSRRSPARRTHAPRRRVAIGTQQLDSMCANHFGREDVKDQGARHIALATADAVRKAVRRFETSDEEDAMTDPLVLGYDTDAAEPTNAFTARRAEGGDGSS